MIIIENAHHLVLSMSHMYLIIMRDIVPDIATNMILYINGVQSNPLLWMCVALYERYQSGIQESHTASADPSTP